jgi:hypothetical protein
MIVKCVKTSPQGFWCEERCPGDTTWPSPARWSRLIGCAGWCCSGSWPWTVSCVRFAGCYLADCQGGSTSRPRLRSEGMAPDGAALETGARHSPGVSSQVGTRPSPTRALFAFKQADGASRSGPTVAYPMGRPMVSAGDEVSASLLAGCATADDVGLYQRAGCPPQLRRGSPPSVAHGHDIDNFLSIG